MTADLASLQYTNQLSVDFSDVVIQQMQGKHPELEWRVADVRNLEVCDDASIDIAIDKVRAEIRMVKPPNDNLFTHIGNHGLYGVRVPVGTS